MGMMLKMRSMAPWFMLTVGGLFVIFMVLSDSRILDFAATQTQNVGSVDGEDISYQDYSAMIEQARKNQEQATGQQINEEQMDYFRDQVWDAMVTQKLIDKKIAEFGIAVSDDEVRDAIMGANPPEMLKRQFTDSTGTFKRQDYETAMRDQRNKEIVVGVEKQIREQLIQQKLQNYLTASIGVSESEAHDSFVKQNIKMKADYIKIDSYLIPDADVKVTEEDMKKYYNEHAEDYKIENQKKIKYVLFRRQASQGDTAMVKKNMDEVVKRAKADTASFKTYVESYSEQPYKKDTVGLASLPAEARTLLANAKAGDIVGPVATFEGYVVYKLSGKKTASSEQVRASHILIRSTGNDAEDKKQIDAIYNEAASSADFATVARAKSQDGSAPQGGDLGWFGKGQMVKPFEDACFGGKIGVVQRPIKTQFGWHIIKVTGRSNQDFIVEKIVNKIQVSATTVDKIFQDAADFAYLAKENGFESEAKAMKYEVLETPPFNEEASAIAGLGINRALVKWAFENGTSEISDVFRFPAGYVTAMISEEIKPGMKPFDEVKEIIKSAVTTEKKLEKAMQIAQQIKNQIGENGDANTAKLIWAQAVVDTTVEFTTSGTIGTLGQEFAFANASYKAELNKWTEPVKGRTSVYLINLKSRSQFDQNAYNASKEGIKKDLLQNKKNVYLSQWIEKLKKKADIVDNRYMFFR
ncbi:MAG: PpiC-type peptidyl-prolyl cis-trans isomerase [Ignavibacteria bacterium]|nr:MAG: PpiC-type peptidyl-prolyl cis-trans isomerase [Ignavibacteria bacterium]KAF0161601.1 MAG: PpiC-type peptidyl-prolyl cis-trans isomerase [Ignavibacteria bacterium]